MIRRFTTLRRLDELSLGKNLELGIQTDEATRFVLAIEIV